MTVEIPAETLVTIVEAVTQKAAAAGTVTAEMQEPQPGEQAQAVSRVQRRRLMVLRVLRQEPE